MLDILKEWSINFVKHRDLFSKNLVDFKVEENSIEFNFKDKKHVYVIMPKLDGNLKEYLKEDYVSVVCLNKKENVKFLISEWNVLIEHKRLNFIFVNPQLNEKWMICPSTHNFVTEKESLILGIKSLFSSIPETK